MTFMCKRGTKPQFRFKKTKTKGVKLRIGGCAKKGKFVKVKEVAKFRKGKKVSTKRLR